jgi:ParB family chromosome partitioning protein
MAKASHQQVNQTSGNVELYTPAELVEAARSCLGAIDLDPASSAVANETVMAERYFTEDDNGLAQPWAGRVWLNHPFGRFEKACKKGCKKKICKQRKRHLKADNPGNEAWINKLVADYQAGNISQALCIVFNSSSETWFRPLLKFPQCILYGRTQFRNPDGTTDGSPPKGCVITYLGHDVAQIARCFAHLGEIKVSYPFNQE